MSEVAWYCLGVSWMNAHEVRLGYVRAVRKIRGYIRLADRSGT
jgi:hypothetical protein